MAGIDQALKQLQQDGHVVEMQTGRRLVENKQIADCGLRIADCGFAVRWTLATAEPVHGGGGSNVFCVGEVSHQFQPLRFAAGKRVERLTEPQITETNFFEHVERIGQTFLLADPAKELDRFVHSQVEHVVNRFAVHLNFEHVRLKSVTFAFGAAHIKVA